jgi:hypothetical protein
MIFHHIPLIFVGIPKNGSTSVHKALWKEDKYGDPFKTRGGHNEHNHNPLSSETLFPYERVCISRDPYTRTISGWLWWRHEIYVGHLGGFKSIFGEEPPTMKDYLKYLVEGYHELSDRNGRWEPHTKPQWWYTTIDGKLGVDRILRLENIKDDWNILKKEYPSIRDITLENQTYVEYSRPDVDDETIELINYLYRKDFEMFDYKMRKV